MSDRQLVHRFRQFLLLMAAFMAAGTILELLLEEHTGEPLQWLPFILCGVGLLAVGVVLLRPQRQTVQLLRVMMIPVGLGGLMGVVEHFESNLAFAAEIQPNVPAEELLFQALSGANPLLAPGILTLLAVLALAATYKW